MLIVISLRLGDGIYLLPNSYRQPKIRLLFFAVYDFQSSRLRYRTILGDLRVHKLKRKGVTDS